MDGRRQISRYVPELGGEGLQDLPPEDLHRLAFKIPDWAVGTPCRVVLAAEECAVIAFSNSAAGCPASTHGPADRIRIGAWRLELSKRECS